MQNNPFNYGSFGLPRQATRRDSDFDQLEATELYCAECGQAVPVVKKLLLVLPEGDKYEYRCRYCGSKVGDKIDRSDMFQGMLR